MATKSLFLSVQGQGFDKFADNNVNYQRNGRHLLEVTCGGGGAILTVWTSDSTPSQPRQAYLGRICLITLYFAGLTCNCSKTSSPMLVNRQPQAQTFSSSGMSWMISSRGRLSGNSLRPVFLRVCFSTTGETIVPALIAQDQTFLPEDQIFWLAAGKSVP